MDGIATENPSSDDIQKAFRELEGGIAKRLFVISLCAIAGCLILTKLLGS